MRTRTLKMVPPPATVGHKHLWVCKPHERGVSRGECSCGAVRFFSDWMSVVDGKILIPNRDRLAELNRRLGREPETQGGKPNMAVKIEDLDRGVLNKLPGLAPVPPKPDVKGLTRGKLMQTMKRYYEENKAAILADFEQLGEAAMLRRWDIPDSTWPILRANFMPERFQLPDWKRKTSRCDHCANAYEHDEQRWCAVARCPSRLRSGIRLPFRPDPVPPRPTGKQEERSSQAVPEERQVIVHVYQLDGFPPFEKCSTAESQCEWLRCYRDLALAAPGEKIFNQRGT